MISGFRSADGTRLPQQAKRRVWWREREDGMVELTARLAKEEAAIVVAAIQTAKDQFGPPPPAPDPGGDAEPEPEPAPGVGRYGNVDGLLDVARVFLDTAPQDRSGEDRNLVVVHVSAENLAGRVPAGTSQPAEAVCHIAGVGY
jgi:hypothetical protein